MATIPFCKVKAIIQITLHDKNGNGVLHPPLHECVVQPEPYHFDSLTKLRLRIRQLAEMSCVQSYANELKKLNLGIRLDDVELDVKVDMFQYQLQN